MGNLWRGEWSNTQSFSFKCVPSGNIYLSDQFNYRIQVFTSNGTFVTACTKGEGDGQFLHPHVPGVDSEGNVYVSDRDLANVQKFTGDGKFMMKWSEEGSNDGQLSKPESVIIDSKDNVYVADFGNHRIQKFTNDGKFILKWGSKVSEMVNLMDLQDCQLIEMTIYTSPTGTIIGYKCLLLTEHFSQNLAQKVVAPVNLFYQKELEWTLIPV